MDENTTTQVEETEVESTENTEPAETDTSKEEAGQKKEKQVKTFTQEEVNKLLHKERLSAEKKFNKINEAEKLKNMSAEERKDAELEMLRKENAELKSERTMNLMLKEVESSLKEANIDTSFASFLVTDDADTTKENITNFTKAWNKALEKAVNARLGGKKPASNSNSKQPTKITIEDVEKMSVEEIQRNYAEIQKLYTNS